MFQLAPMLPMFDVYIGRTLAFMLYATEVMPLSKHLLNTLDSCVNQAVAKIFNICDKDSINQIRMMCDLPDVSMIVK